MKVTVERLTFSETAAKLRPVQVWYDPHRKVDRTCRYLGNCLGCGRTCWAFDDGENDPRGVLGDHANWPVTVTLDDETEHYVTACSVCANDYEAHQVVQRRGKRLVESRPRREFSLRGGE